MELNKVQSKIPENLQKELGREFFTEFMDYIDSIPFIYNLIKKDRRYIKDMPKDDKGRVIVSLENPHILENMDYFREAATTFESIGKYTQLLPNSYPNSEYVKFWKEEGRRCREGLIRDDGEWISGLNYFYWNYSPILLVGDDSEGMGVRVEGFPNPWDGDYLYFHYLEKCRREGKHAFFLKARGRGHSYKAGSILAKIFKLGDRQTPETSRVNQTAFAIANEKEYLT